MSNLIQSCVSEINEESKAKILKDALQELDNKNQKKLRILSRIELIKQKLKEKQNEKIINDNNIDINSNIISNRPVDIELKSEKHIQVLCNSTKPQDKSKELFTQSLEILKPEPKAFQGCSLSNNKSNIEDSYKSTSSMDVYGMKSIANRKRIMKNKRLINQNNEDKIILDNIKTT
jgi:hypothetical protein